MDPRGVISGHVTRHQSELSLLPLRHTLRACYALVIPGRKTRAVYVLSDRGLENRGCAGGRIGTRFLRPRGTSPLKGVTPRELRGIEMGPRASSAD